MIISKCVEKANNGDVVIDFFARVYRPLIISFFLKRGNR